MTLTGKYFNKKGGIPDLIYFIVIIVVVSIITVVSWKIYKLLDDNVQGSNLYSQQGKDISSNLRSRFVAVNDNAFLIVFVGLIIAIIVGAWFLSVHPALFWISIPILAFLIFLAAIYANVFNNFVSTEMFSNEIADFPMISFVMQHYVYFITFIIMIVAIALFAKSNKEGL